MPIKDKQINREFDTIALDSVLDKSIPTTTAGALRANITANLNSNALINEPLDKTASVISDAITECRFYSKHVIIQTEDIINSNLIRLTISGDDGYYRKSFLLSKCTGILEEILKDSDSDMEEFASENGEFQLDILLYHTLSFVPEETEIILSSKIISEPN